MQYWCSYDTFIFDAVENKRMFAIKWCNGQLHACRNIGNCEANLRNLVVTVTKRQCERNLFVYIFSYVFKFIPKFGSGIQFLAGEIQGVRLSFKAKDITAQSKTSHWAKLNHAKAYSSNMNFTDGNITDTLEEGEFTYPTACLDSLLTQFALMTQ